MNTVSITCPACKRENLVNFCQTCCFFGVDPACKLHKKVTDLPITYPCVVCHRRLASANTRNGEIVITLH